MENNSEDEEERREERQMDGGRRQKGRGFENADIIDDEVKHSRNDRYETLRESEGERGQPQKSIEGWVVLVTGVHEEAQEEDVHENFGDFGEISNLHLNLDRRTGFVKGYCLIEYKEKEEAKSAIENMDGKLMLDQEVRVDWAFVNAPEKKIEKEYKAIEYEIQRARVE
ncbi:unnamed protein product [Bathycoccus prasinos]